MSEMHELTSNFRFRQHRGSLEQSLLTLEYKNALELLEDAWNDLKRFGVKRIEMRARLYSDAPDRRVNWDKTFVVIIKGYGVFGFADRSPFVGAMIRDEGGVTFDDGSDRTRDKGEPSSDGS